MDRQDKNPGNTLRRCPGCDSVISEDQAQCLMCGRALELDDAQKEQGLAETPVIIDASIPVPEEAEDGFDPSFDSAERFIESEMRERLSPITYILTAIFAVIIVIVGILVLMYPTDAAIEFIPTVTPIPEVSGLLETALLEPTDTIEPTWTPTPEDTPFPTATPQPPRAHTVASGETLFGLSLRYGISMDSIAGENGFPVDTALQVSQQILIPWPTATPPLVPVEVEVGDEVIIADPSDCEVYEIKGGDTLFGIAASFNVPSPALLAANRLSEVSVLQPGDTICIPEIIYGSAGLATAGPSPTAGPTLPPSGPDLLFPAAGATVTAGRLIPANTLVLIRRQQGLSGGKGHPSSRCRCGDGIAFHKISSS